MKLSKSVTTALDMLCQSGYKAWLVGGAPRDIQRGITPSDYDIATPSTPDETKRVFEGFPVFLQGEKHGTVGVIIDGEKLEITTFRADGEYINHRSPESVSFSRNIENDLSRRDFTINALAWSPTDNTLLDLFGGKNDIENKIIRAVGDPDTRFREDALRILRAVRFSAKLGYEIEQGTRAAICKNKELILEISGERIREELEKIMIAPCAREVICDHDELFKVMFNGFDKEKFSALFKPDLDLRERLCALFLSCDGEGAIKRLKFSRQDTSFFKSTLLAYHDKTSLETEYSIKKCACQYGLSPFKASLKLRGLNGALVTLEKAVLDGECILKSDLKLCGRDLIAEGFEAGENIGKILDSLFEAVLQGKIKNEKDSLIKEAKKL